MGLNGFTKSLGPINCSNIVSASSLIVIITLVIVVILEI